MSKIDRGDKRPTTEKPMETQLIKKLEEVGREVGRGVERTFEILSKFSPRTAISLVSLVVAASSVYLIGSTMLAISPFVSQMLTYLAPLLAMFIQLFIVLSILSLFIGVMRAVI